MDNQTIQLTLTIGGIEKNITGLNELKGVLKDNGIEIQNLGKEAEQARSKMAKIGDSVSMFALLGGSVGEAAGKFKAVTEIVEKVNTGFKMMKIAIIETGIGALVVALGAVISYLKSTTEGSDKLSAALAYVRGFVQPLINGFRDFGSAIMHPVESIKKIGDSIKDFFGTQVNLIFKVIDDIKHFNFKSAIIDSGKLVYNLSGIGTVVDGVTRLAKAGNEAGNEFAELAVKTRELDRAEKTYGATSVKIHGEIREAMLKARDPLLSPKVRSDELHKAVELEKQDSDKLIGFAKQRMSILEQENKHGKIVGDEFFNEKAELNKKIAELETERDDKLTQLEVRDDRLTKQSIKRAESEQAKKERLHNTYLQLLDDFNKKIDQKEIDSHENRLKIIDDSLQKEIDQIKAKKLAEADEIDLLNKAQILAEKERVLENTKAEAEYYAGAKDYLSNYYKDKKTLLETSLADNKITDEQFKKQNLQNQLDDNAGQLSLAQTHLATLAENDVKGRQKINDEIINLELQKATLLKAVRDDQYADSKKQLEISLRDETVSKKDYYDKLIELDKQYGKDSSEVKKKYRDAEKKSIQNDEKLAVEAVKNVAQMVINSYKEQEKAADKRYADEKLQIQTASKYATDQIKQDSEVALNTEGLTTRQKNVIKQQALQKEKEITDKALADDIAAKKKADDEKKDLAKKAAAVQFAIQIATIISTTAAAVMKDLADPMLIPPFDAIAAVATSVVGATQLGLAYQQFDAVQSLGAGTIDENSRLIGPSHEQGGIKIGRSVVEGGEGIVRKNAMNNPMISSLIKQINQTPDASLNNLRITPASQLTKSVIRDKNRDAPQRIYVLEKDITKTQEKVAKIQKGAVL